MRIIKAQLSIEYLILLGFVFAMVITPAAFLLNSFAGGKYYEAVNTHTANDIGKGLIKNAKEVYYLGLYSKQQVDYQMPQNVKRFFVLETVDSTSDEADYYIVILVDGKLGNVEKYVFQSDVPLYIDLDPSNPLVGGEQGDEDIEVCDDTSDDIECNIFNLMNPFIEDGTRTFSLETRLVGADAKVEISPK